MNTENYNKLKFKYKMYFVLIVWRGIALTFYPALKYALWLESQFPESMRDWFFDLLYLSGFFAFVISGCLVITFVICKYKGWTREQAIDYFIKYENFPSHWLKTTE
jgi:hypothetical protein